MDLDGTKFFDPNSLRFAQNPSTDSRARLVYITPAEFLSVAMSGHAPEKLAGVTASLAADRVFRDIPFLNFVHDGEGTAVVTGHEGRHRAKLLQEMGVTQIPVLLCHRYDPNGQPMVWQEIEQGNGKFYDEWPRRLYGQPGDSPEADQHRKNWITFPVPDLRIENELISDFDVSASEPSQSKIAKNWRP